MSLESSTGASEGKHSNRFNNAVAVSVAIISAFLAFTSIKGSNVAQAIQGLNRETANYWNQYQAKRLRQFGLELQLQEMRISIQEAGGVVSSERQALIAKWDQENRRYIGELGELRAEATSREAQAAVRNVLDDQLDLAQAFLALSLALLAVAALTQLAWLLALGFGVGGIGVFFGLAAFLHWTWVHPGWLVRLIGG